MKELSSIDNELFDATFRSTYPVLCMHAHQMLGDVEEARDIVQSVFISLLARETPPESNLKGYLYKAVHNRCLHAINARKRKRNSIKIMTFLSDETAFSYPGEKEEQKNLKKLMESLPPQRQKAMELVFFQQLQYKQAAGRMGISINSLKTHIKLGLSSLRKSILTR
ncbi:sigma-70 family RNA polymerase sigma factor [Chitinophaga niabensis]|uniref:RNA polymerase sigma-70 factor, ECF subfamily n=1 Tax=Chitinophaga niabensis TaxID=536979 RepID=A0A1N6KAL6_9BACT|nr:sigma-70 family RNA polymerase sigma factor [Chitinophaga niabensis]SIO53581.1 RNA polymerase sigma-70 factor, ECF subfamily [Chitinophaga niabensis]